MGFGYDVTVMISRLFNCPQQLRILIVGFGSIGQYTGNIVTPRY